MMEKSHIEVFDLSKKPLYRESFSFTEPEGSGTAEVELANVLSSCRYCSDQKLVRRYAKLRTVGLVVKQIQVPRCESVIAIEGQ